MVLLRLFRRLVDQLEVALTATGALLLAVVVVLAGSEIVLRAVFRASSIEVVTLSTQLAVLMIFIGYPALIAGGRDIQMDYVYRRLPRPMQRVISVLTEIAILGFFVLLVVKAFDLYRLSERIRHPVFPVSNAVVVIPAIVGGILGAVVALRRSIDAVVGAEVHSDGESGGERP